MLTNETWLLTIKYTIITKTVDDVAKSYCPT